MDFFRWGFVGVPDLLAVGTRACNASHDNSHWFAGAGYIEVWLILLIRCQHDVEADRYCMVSSIVRRDATGRRRLFIWQSP